MPRSIKATIRQLRCDAKPVAPDEYYHPELEQNSGRDSPGKNPSDKPKETNIYIAGWEISTFVITMASATDDGEPYYSTDYRIESLKDCSSDVSINETRHSLTFMPDSLAFKEEQNKNI